MASVIKAGNATDGVQVTSDNTGILELKTGTGAGTTAMTVGTDQSVTFAQAANLPNTFGFKNRIINGAMVIDQRNAGASVTITNTSVRTYTLDRWSAYGTAASKFSVQQNAGSVTPPAGFVNYFGATSLSAYSVTSGDIFNISQTIEGFNIADLAWGTANASSVTLSFRVYSSLTGTFGGALTNSNNSRCYPFSFTVSAANTWTSVSITIAGDTTGTWGTGNGIGIGVTFSLGMGSTYTGTANAWTGSLILAPTGSVSVVGTNGATFYITGVQLEKGSTATSFDYRPYTTELQLCQRYYYKLSSDSANAATLMAPGVAYSTTQTAQHLCAFPVTMRSRPTASISGTIVLYVNSLVTTITGIVTQNSSTTQGTLNFQVASGLTAATYYTVICQNTTGFIDFAAEL